ncbi:MAG: hypothetical protein HOG49_18315 [Candidatus Scalindua sp.]|jgi:hypothetical protein|nr:hypothetical protein [Candidatus Scalindua sp.]
MVLLWILGMVFFGGLALIAFSEYDGYDIGLQAGIGLGASILGGLALLVMLLALPIQRMDTKQLIRDAETTRVVIKEARKDAFGDVERMALISDVISLNKRIVNAKYWNNTFYDIWISDEIENLEMLK